MNRLIQWATNRWLLALTAVLVIYALVGFLLLPFLVRHYTPHLAAELLKRQASVREVQFNPFLFTFEAEDLALNEADGQPVLGLERLFLDFEPSRSITSRAIALADLRLDGLSANLVVDPEGKLNLVKMVDSLPKSGEPLPPPSDEQPPRILVQHFLLADGKVEFTDLSRPTPHTESVEHLQLEINGISTLPDRTGTQQVQAQLPKGGKLAWWGELSLNPIASSGELKIEGFRLATRWNFFRDRIHLAEPAGEISMSARYKFSYSKGKTELTVHDAAFKLAGLSLATADTKETLLALDEISFDAASVDLAGRSVRVPSFVIRKGSVHAAVDEAGKMNWLTLFNPEPGSGGPKPAEPALEPSQPGQPWKLVVDRFEISELGVNYVDTSRKSPFAVSVGNLGLSLGVEAEAGAGAPKARVDNLAAQANRVAVAHPGRQEPWFGWDLLAVEGGRLDLEKQEATVNSVLVKGGDLTLVREADGTLRPLDVFAARESDGPAPSAEMEKEGTGQPEGDRWHFALDEFALQGFGVALIDRSLSPELALNLDDIQVTAKNVTNDGKTPVAFDAKLKVRQGGVLQTSGAASPRGDAAHAKIGVDRFELKPLQPIVSRFAALKLDSGDLSTDLDLDFRQGEPNASVKATGSVTLNGLSLKETKDDKRFLAWETLAVKGMQFSLAPDSLSIKEVRIVRPDTTIEIFKDRNTNIAAVLKPQKAETLPPNPYGKPEESKPSTVKPSTFPVSVERVRINDGLIDFSDAGLVLPFAIRIHDFDGAIAGISTAPNDQASLNFEGRVGDFGQVKVDGSLRPMQIKSFSQTKVVFRNVAMPSLSPYSATFAGRKIESGKLNLDLDYTIENSHLKSENRIVLEQFTLGERVESPNAISLPLDLAIALLTDTEGRISATVPIEGDVDNPKFSYGKLVGDALKTLVKKVVTAPFLAIASAFGSAEEHPDTVLFEPAKDTVPPPEREKLKELSEALALRPKLKLIIHGRFHPKLDGEALKSLEVRRRLARKMDITLAPGQEPDAVSFGSAAAQRALEKLAAEHDGMAEAAEADYRKETGKSPQRLGAMAGLMGRASETPEFYEKLFKKLVERTPLPPGELEALAARRGLALMTELVDQQHFDRARIAIDKIESTEDSTDGNVPTRLELAADPASQVSSDRSLSGQPQRVSRKTLFQENADHASTILEHLKAGERVAAIVRRCTQSRPASSSVRLLCPAYLDTQGRIPHLFQPARHRLP